MYTKIYTNTYVQTLGYKQICINPYLQTLMYTQLCKNPYVQTLIYKSLCTNPYIQTIMYNPLCTNLYVQTLMYKPLYTNHQVGPGRQQNTERFIVGISQGCSKQGCEIKLRLPAFTGAILGIRTFRLTTIASLNYRRKHTQTQEQKQLINSNRSSYDGCYRTIRQSQIKGRK